jgi:hypothetical protein
MTNIKKFMDKKVVELNTMNHAFNRDYAVMKEKYPGVYCSYTPMFEFLEPKVFIDVNTMNDMFPKLVKPVRLEMVSDKVVVKYNYIHGFQNGVGEVMDYNEASKLQECSTDFVNSIIRKLNNTLGQTLQNYNEFSGLGGE